MGDLVKFAKAWAVVALLSRLMLALAVCVLVVFVTVGDGGRFSIEWKPGVHHERSE
ncbi:hypothetical protein [Teredinibacter turnerae]|uniref:hypothetical protein n=1 Tax=Teredinibacter turnerae TaxID=2426 RepID=UPI000B2A2089|nr:hypothetical protein [Teredinibacter turnerae]